MLNLELLKIKLIVWQHRLNCLFRKHDFRVCDEWVGRPGKAPSTWLGYHRCIWCSHETPRKILWEWK